ncbi:MAG: glycosyltransferase family 2 protein [Solirubrobacteraceae bacterium]
MQSEPVSQPSVAVAVPAYNEADGIAGFLTEIDQALSPQVSSLRLIVVDDASTDATASVLADLTPRLDATLEILRNEVNRGHGPSVIRAYRQALAHGPDYVLQVDGDGQFHGSDLRRVLVLLIDEAHAVSGVRRFRQDPWFRMVMTRLVRFYVGWGFGVHARDPNCPLRGYESDLLRGLLEAIPDPCLVPNLYLTVVASRRGLALLEVDVSHRVRRGASAQGTTWVRGSSPIPWRLVRFSIDALRESRRFRASVDVSGHKRDPQR